MSPSIEKTPSVMRSCRLPSRFVSVSLRSASSASRCSKTAICARDSRAPSMIDAWLSRSLTITSSLPRIAATVPALAVNPDWNMRAASACLNVAKRRSSSRWISIWPAIVRTAPLPAPRRAAASAAARFIRGWFASPR